MGSPNHTSYVHPKIEANAFQTHSKDNEALDNSSSADSSLVSGNYMADNNHMVLDNLVEARMLSHLLSLGYLTGRLY